MRSVCLTHPEKVRGLYFTQELCTDPGNSFLQKRERRIEGMGIEKKYDVTALGELLIDFTQNGMSEQGNNLFEANPGHLESF